jgi:hypothetical protein
LELHRDLRLRHHRHQRLAFHLQPDDRAGLDPDDCSWNKNTGAYNGAPHTAVSYPASDPDVLGIGGTSIAGYNNNGHFVWTGEPAWQGGSGWGSCGGNNGGSGGGKSAITSLPSYQTGVANGATQRLVPDISLNSGGIAQEYYYNGGLHPVGGTSIAAPEFAGFFAQENAYLDAVGNICGSGHNAACSPIGDPHGDLYYQGVHKYAYHNPYYDIIAGCNSNDATAYYKLGYFCAGQGYDLVTGWGAANMLQLAWALNWAVLNNYANGVPYVTFSGPATGKWYNTNQIVNIKINDYAGNVSKPHPTGIAGLTFGWDSIPTDPTSQPNPGSGNAFYSGPEYPNSATGCISLANGGCAGSVSQGCHTLHAHGWNNEGWTTTSSAASYPETYGPICYDTVAPVTTDTLSGTKSGSGYTGTVTVSLSATDQGSSNGTGSGVATTYYSVTYGKTVGKTQTYTAPFKVSYNGTITIKYYSVDKAGNTETTKSISFTD